jgi:RNA polymerase sigma-70 factor (ECF subfamily)
VADAEDVTQQVLYRFAQHLRSFVYDGSRSFRGWLKTVARHAWSDLADQQHRATPGTGGEARTAILGSAEARDSLEQRLDGLFDHELMEQAMARVQARVEPHTWEAFRRLALEGHSGADVARDLGLKVATAFKARSKVQKMIQEEVSRLEGPDTPRLP